MLKPVRVDIKDGKASRFIIQGRQLLTDLHNQSLYLAWTFNLHSSFSNPRVCVQESVFFVLIDNMTWQNEPYGGWGSYITLSSMSCRFNIMLLVASVVGLVNNWSIDTTFHLSGLVSIRSLTFRPWTMRDESRVELTRSIMPSILFPAHNHVVLSSPIILKYPLQRMFQQFCNTFQAMDCPDLILLEGSENYHIYLSLSLLPD